MPPDSFVYSFKRHDWGETSRHLAACESSAFEGDHFSIHIIRRVRSQDRTRRHPRPVHGWRNRKRGSCGRGIRLARARGRRPSQRAPSCVFHRAHRDRGHTGSLPVRRLRRRFHPRRSEARLIAEISPMGSDRLQHHLPRRIAVRGGRIVSPEPRASAA